MLRNLFNRSQILTSVGLAHLVLAAVLIVAAMFEGRTVLGVNLWFKPIKFALSLAIYLLTIAFFVGFFKKRMTSVKLLSIGISLTMIAEIACITYQAGRGTMSHFNTASALDGALFGIMGAAIFVDMIFNMILLALFLFRPVTISGLPLAGIRLGLLAFVGLGTFSGMAMITNGAHTVGAPDGGTGLPLVNWSTKNGDLRIAHLLSIHSLQIVPLIALAFDRLANKWHRVARMAIYFVVVATYISVVLAMYSQAMNGNPLVTR